MENMIILDADEIEEHLERYNFKDIDDFRYRKFVMELYLNEDWCYNYDKQCFEFTGERIYEMGQLYFKS